MIQNGYKGTYLKMNNKEIIELKIEDMLDDGRAFGRHEGVAVFVDGGVVGDTVHAEIIKIKKSFAEARFLGIVTPSPDRIEAECPYASECGGCSLQELNYDAQIELKKNQVLSKLERIAGIENPTVDEIIPATNTKYYRNKATFAVGPHGEVGFYKNKTHFVMDIEDCILQSDPAVACADALRRFLDGKASCIRQMVVKTAFGTGEVMVVLESDKKDIPEIEKLVDMLDESLEYTLCSVAVINNNKCKIIAGKATITDELIAGDDKTLQFEIGSQSFYQVNSEQMTRLYQKATEYAELTGHETVLDLYCGIGTIGLFMSDQAEQIIGIESVKPAVIDANRNAVINGIINARYFAGKAEEILPEILNGEKDINVDSVDVAIVDPPRAGCDEALIHTLASAKARRIVYVSCDAGTLARDIKYLTANGYKFDRISIVDQFPWTNHIETVCLLDNEN